MGRTLQEWEDRVRDRLGDLGVIQHIPTERIPFSIDSALAILAVDKPREVKQTFAGDGSTYDFTLTDADWIQGDGGDPWSRITAVEFPIGNREPTYIELRRVTVLKGTLTFRFLIDTPASGQSADVWYSTKWPFPTDTATVDKVPDTWFEGVCSRAAAEAASSQAGEYARKQRNSVAGDFFDLDYEALRTAARDLRAHYDKIVLGKPMDSDGGDSGSVIGYAISDVNVFPNALFHVRRA